MILGIIPARGGSKRLPGKNIRKLHGKPLIAWTIEAAKKSERLDRLVVSTDDDRIASVAESCGAEVLKRSPSMAQDTSSIYDTIFDILDQIPAEWVVLLQPTSPLRTARDIDNIIDFALTKTVPSVVSCEYTRPVPNGAVYVAYVSWLREHRNFDGPRTIAYGMPSHRSVDIDTIADFERAEVLMGQKNG